MDNQIRWLGNAGFELQLNGSTLIVDPFLTRPKFWQTYFGQVAPDKATLQEHIPHCDHILITHAHFDHCMDAPEIARRSGARVHGSYNTCQLMQAAGLPTERTHPIQAGDSFQIADVQISVLPAAHPWIPGYTRGELGSDLHFPLRLRDYRMDSCYSFLISYNGMRILIWSSTSSQGAAQADLLTCRAVSRQRWYDDLLAQVNPGLVFPQHWDDTYQPLDGRPRPFFGAPRLAIPPLQRIDLQDFKARIQQAKPNTKVILPEIFESYKLDDLLPS